MKELKLIPPTDPRVQSAIAPFNNEMLKDEGFKDRKELSEAMFDAMKKYGGIGLSANQVGLPFNMFVLGDHPDLEKGLKMTCFNPMIVSAGEETIMMKEGCLTYPFIFLDIKYARLKQLDLIESFLVLLMSEEKKDSDVFNYLLSRKINDYEKKYIDALEKMELIINDIVDKKYKVSLLENDTYLNIDNHWINRKYNNLLKLQLNTDLITEDIIKLMNKF